MKPVLTTETQTLFLSSAIFGLMGSCTESLCALPKDEALNFLARVADGSASIVWTVEAQGEEATVRCEGVMIDGSRITISLNTISLQLDNTSPAKALQ